MKGRLPAFFSSPSHAEERAKYTRLHIVEKQRRFPLDFEPPSPGPLALSPWPLAEAWPRYVVRPWCAASSPSASLPPLESMPEERHGTVPVAGLCAAALR